MNRKNNLKQAKRKGVAVVVGCSGYGNMGDDLYPLVIKKHFKEVEFVFKNSDNPRKVHPDCKLLIIGPGGIIYENETAHFQYMSEYMDQAIKRKIPMVFLSCGVQPDNINSWKKYLDYAEFITVRSENDLKMIRQVSDNKNIFYYPDLGYIFDDYEEVKNLPSKYTVFIPISSAEENNKWLPITEIYKNLPPEERVLLRMGSMMDSQIFDSWLKLGEAKTILNVTPQTANYVIKNAQMVYTGRYHGMVLARRNSVPFDTGGARLLKLINEDRESNFFNAAGHTYKLAGVLKKYLNLKKKKIAIIHDDFSISGGGEKLVSIMADSLLKNGYETEIYTFALSENTKKMIPGHLKIHTLKEKKTVSNDDTIKRFLFSELSLKDKFDFFIFSGHSSLCAAKLNKPNMLYCHNLPKSEPNFPKAHPYEMIDGGVNPQNMLVLNEDDVQTYLSSVKEVNFFDRWWRKLYVLKMKYRKEPILPEFIANKIDALRFILNRTMRINSFKFLSYQSTHKENLREIDRVVTNSNNIKIKVRKKYKRDSEIIYPPIETSLYKYLPHRDYWVSINRVVPLKRIELQLKAFALIPDEHLYIVGDIENKEYFDYLQSIKPPNVNFLGAINEDEKISLLSESIGFIFTAHDEDFGMAVVEAMASGKPVIAPNEGGCMETVIHDKTGLLIAKMDEHKLVDAIREIRRRPESFKDACIKRAREFDAFYFIKKIISNIEVSS